VHAEQPATTERDDLDANDDLDVLDDLDAIDASDAWDDPPPSPRRRWISVGNRLVELDGIDVPSRERRARAIGRRFQDRARWRLR
jgi:hypothetical protein